MTPRRHHILAALMLVIGLTHTAHADDVAEDAAEEAQEDAAEEAQEDAAAEAAEIAAEQGAEDEVEHAAEDAAEHTDDTVVDGLDGDVAEGAASDSRTARPELPFTGADEEAEDEVRKKRIAWLIVPSVFYSPETQLGGGIAGAVFFRPEGAGEYARLSQVAATANYTMLRQTIIAVLPELYLFDDQLYLSSELTFQIYPYKFYGLGPETTVDDEEVYTTTSLRAINLAAWRVNRGLYVGLGTALTTHRLDSVEEGGLLDTRAVPGTQSGASVGAGPAFLWDTRDYPAGPTSGAFLYGALTFYQPAFGSSWAYTRARIDARTYQHLGGSHVLAFQFYTESTAGNVPYFDHPRLGGATLMRGFLSGRFSDRQFVTTQAEWRYPIWWRFGGVAFAGAGDVSRRLDGFALNRLKYNMGAGLRFAIQPDDRINLRFDLGVASTGDVGFYISVREAF